MVVASIGQPFSFGPGTSLAVSRGPYGLGQLGSHERDAPHARAVEHARCLAVVKGCVVRRAAAARLVFDGVRGRRGGFSRRGCVGRGVGPWPSRCHTSRWRSPLVRRAARGAADRPPQGVLQAVFVMGAARCGGGLDPEVLGVVAAAQAERDEVVDDVGAAAVGDVIARVDAALGGQGDVAHRSGIAGAADFRARCAGEDGAWGAGAGRAWPQRRGRPRRGRGAPGRGQRCRRALRSRCRR